MSDSGPTIDSSHPLSFTQTGCVWSRQTGGISKLDIQRPHQYGASRANVNSKRHDNCTTQQWSHMPVPGCERTISFRARAFTRQQRNLSPLTRSAEEEGMAQQLPQAIAAKYTNP